jgi:hypothetical protein
MSFNTGTFKNRGENEVAIKFHKIRHSDIRPTIFTTFCIQFASRNCLKIGIKCKNIFIISYI